MFIAAFDRRFEIDPAAMQRAGRATAGFRLGFSMAASLALQRGGEARTLLRVIAKECLQCWISNALSGLLKTFLTIFERFNQIVFEQYFPFSYKLSRFPRGLRVSFSFRRLANF